MTLPQQIHILYLEDDPDSIELVRFSLGIAGIRVTTATSGDVALSLAAEESFDLFLLDGLLPSGYSFDLCPKLREASPGTPVVFYTALGFPTEIQRGTDAGADAYLVKPFLGDLAETLIKIIQDSGQKLLARGAGAVDCQNARL